MTGWLSAVAWLRMSTQGEERLGAAMGPHQPATDDPATQVARLRRAVLAGHRRDRGAALWLRRDDDPAVRAAALGALERMGALDVPTVLDALADDEAGVRRRGCTVAGHVLGGGAAAGHVPDAGGPSPGALTQELARILLHDTEPSVVESAAWALGEAPHGGGTEALDALMSVAAEHDDPLCREAAVAALGSVGDQRALSSVVRALADKPAVRRRAAVALAAFDGPQAEAALRRCLEDRDWQVRQVAEDLLRDA